MLQDARQLIAQLQLDSTMGTAPQIRMDACQAVRCAALIAASIEQPDQYAHAARQVSLYLQLLALETQGLHYQPPKTLSLVWKHIEHVAVGLQA